MEAACILYVPYSRLRAHVSRHPHGGRRANGRRGWGGRCAASNGGDGGVTDIHGAAPGRTAGGDWLVDPRLRTHRGPGEDARVVATRFLAFDHMHPMSYRVLLGPPTTCRGALVMGKPAPPTARSSLGRKRGGPGPGIREVGRQSGCVFTLVVPARPVTGRRH